LGIVTRYLTDKKIKDPEKVAMVSGGMIYSALKLASSGEAGVLVDLAFDTLINLRSSADVLKFSSKIVALKKDFSYFVDTLIMILRDASVCSQSNLINYKDRAGEVSQIAKIFSHKARMEITEKLCEIYNKLEFNCNLVGVVDQILLYILEVKFLCQ